MDKKFTLVSTVFNEMNRLSQTISDIENQTLRPSQIIIVDAGSSDGTMQLLTDWKNSSQIELIVLEKKGCNVAEGRNLAIEAAQNQLIASTDFGCRFEPDWLETLMAPFADDATQIVAGSYKVKEDYIDTLAAKADWILSNGYQIQMDQYFVPSSRSIAYYKHVWQSVGGYPEWVSLAADDSTFAYLIQKKQIPFVYVNEQKVYWLRHKTFLGFKKECVRYGLGEGETRSGLKNFFSNLIETLCRYSIPFFVILAVSGLINIWLIAALGILAVFGLRSYKNAVKNWLVLRSEKYNFKVLLTSFYLIEISRIAHIHGYIKGYFFSPAYRKEAAIKLQQILKK